MALFLGFLVSTFVSTLAIADTQDDRFRIASLSGELEIPVVGDLKTPLFNLRFFYVTNIPGLLVPDFISPNIMPERPGDASTLIQRRRMLYTAYTKPDAWEASVSK